MTLSLSVEQNGASCERPAIVIVDHYPLWRSCLARILRGELQDYTILEIETPHQLGSIVGKAISLVALNIGSSAMTDQRVLNSLSYLRRLLPDGPLMLLTRLEESAISDAMISEITPFGVKGYITHSASLEIALAALRLIIAGGIYFPRSLVIDCASWVPVSSEKIVTLQPAIAVDGIATELPAITNKTNIAFTERERQVLATLLRGMSNKVIANELKLSQNTVKSHISRIMQKLHAKNRTEAVVLSQHSAQITNGGSQNGISDA